MISFSVVVQNIDQEMPETVCFNYKAIGGVVCMCMHVAKYLGCSQNDRMEISYFPVSYTHIFREESVEHILWFSKIDLKKERKKNHRGCLIY